MIYINQKEYSHIPYPTGLDCPDLVHLHHGSVSDAGCGLCSLCMVVDRLTTEHLSLEASIQLSIESAANRTGGTDLKVLAPVVATKYQLDLQTTSDTDVMLAHLKNGGVVIAHVGGDRDDYLGVFSHIGHYITLLWANEQTICILDPSWHSAKYENAVAQGLVVQDGVFLYCKPELLAKETGNRTPSYYLFQRHIPL